MRYCCELYKNNEMVDDNCVIGFDEGMNTFFFQSGEENHSGEPVIWIGRKFFEFSSLESIENFLHKKGYQMQVDAEDRNILQKNTLISEAKKPSFLKKLFGIRA